MGRDRRPIEEGEVTVVGGGPAGAIAAFTLASAGPRCRSHRPGRVPAREGMRRRAHALRRLVPRRHRVERRRSRVPDQIDGIRLVADWKPREVTRWHGDTAGQAPCAIPRRRARRCARQLRRARWGAAGTRAGDGADPAATAASAACGSFTRTPRPASSPAGCIAADGATSRIRRNIARTARRRTCGRNVRGAQILRAAEPLEPVFDVYAPVDDPAVGLWLGVPCVRPPRKRRYRLRDCAWLAPAGRDHGAARLVHRVATEPSRVELGRLEPQGRPSGARSAWALPRSVARSAA